jgi:hypothetical protein
MDEEEEQDQTFGKDRQGVSALGWMRRRSRIRPLARIDKASAPWDG